MLELLIFISLCGVFWRYGKEMGSGKWITLGCFILCCGALWSLGVFLITPILAAIPTGILAMILSSMNDQEKKKAVLERQARERSSSCPNCKEPIVGPQTRCNRCGRSLAAA